ncbi:hypothetical protein D3C76_1179890 [compost metagenome]
MNKRSAGDCDLPGVAALFSAVFSNTGDSGTLERTNTPTTNSARLAMKGMRHPHAVKSSLESKALTTRSMPADAMKPKTGPMLLIAA